MSDCFGKSVWLPEHGSNIGEIDGKHDTHRDHRAVQHQDVGQTCNITNTPVTCFQFLELDSKVCEGFTIMENAPTRAFSSLKERTSAFALKIDQDTMLNGK